MRTKMILIFIMALGSILAGISGALDLYVLLGPIRAYIAFGLFILFAIFMIIVVSKDNRELN